MARSRFFGKVKHRSLDRTLKRLGDKIEKELSGEFKKAAFAINAEVKNKIRQRGGGKTVIRYDPTRVHQVSLPGEPPAGDTGRLMSAVGHSVDIDGLGAKVSISGVGYAKDLEFGTSKMAARPVLGPTFEEEKPKLKRRIINAIRRAGRKARKK